MICMFCGVEIIEDSESNEMFGGKRYLHRGGYGNYEYCKITVAAPVKEVF